MKSYKGFIICKCFRCNRIVDVISAEDYDYINLSEEILLLLNNYRLIFSKDRPDINLCICDNHKEKEMLISKCASE